MANSDLTPIRIERAMEQLRQEREVFDQRKSQESRWFLLRLSMGYASVVLLFAVIVISALVLFNTTKFPDFTVKAAGVALFADVVGLLVGVWKIVLKPDFMTKLTAETQEGLLGMDEDRNDIERHGDSASTSSPPVS
jgi:hypothetical protein